MIEQLRSDLELSNEELERLKELWLKSPKPLIPLILMGVSMTTITRRYHFESAHWLPGVPKEHKCHRMHGHNYEMEVTIQGMVDPVTGFIMDFWDLDKVVHPIINTIDHRTLNDIEGLKNPTAEHIARWFLHQLVAHGAVAVRIYETKDCWADVKAD